MPVFWLALIFQLVFAQRLRLLPVASALSFFGLGAQDPTPDWGLMVAEGQNYFTTQWWLVTFPGLAILLTALAFNLLGDGLRDVLDPRRVLIR
jgi:peptide/nickel transport system permease protein